ncbi:MAG: hypothetical protein ACRCXB_27965 [Aeromonadaceae bacterium]
MTRISDLNLVQDLTDSDVFPIGTPDGTTRGVTASDAAKYFTAEIEPIVDEAKQAADEARASAEAAAESAASSDALVLRQDLAKPSGSDLVYWSHLNELSVSMSISSRLRKKIYSSDLGVSSSSSPSHNQQAMQWMVDQSSSGGVSAVFDVSCSLPSGGIALKSGAVIYTPVYVTIKALDGIDSPVLTQGSATSLSDVYIEGGTFDGNQANAPRVVATSVFSCGICERIAIKNAKFINGSGYGVAYQARPQSTISAFLRGVARDLVLDNVTCSNNGSGAASGGDNYDGLDIKYVEGCLVSGLKLIGNADKGCDIRGDRVFIRDSFAASNGSHGFGFSASFSDTGYPVKGSFFLSSLYSDSNGESNFYFSEGADGNTVQYSVVGSGLYGKGAGTQGFRFDAPNADIMLSTAQSRGSLSHGIYSKFGVNSLNITSVLVRDCSGNGITLDAAVASPVQFSSIDIIASGYGAAVYGPEAVIFNGGRLSGTAGPIRVDALSANPILNGIIDGDVTYKKGDVIANSSATLQLKLGLDNVMVSSSVTINNISPMIEGRDIAILASGSLTFQNSSAMQLKSSPTTVSDGNVIKLVAINGKWRQV